MNNTDTLSSLRSSFEGKDWFNDVDFVQDRIVVYANFMSLDVMKAVPQQVDGKQVLLHFAASKPTQSVSYKPVIEITPLALKETLISDIPSEPNYELEYLQSELDRLELLCNSNTLQDIFFEVHDGINAITNLSSKYPEIRKDMQILYDDYGFDVIYDQLDS